MASVNEKKVQEAWTTDDIRRNAGNWNLAGDSGMLRHLHNFSENLIARSNNISSNIEEMFNGLMDANIGLKNVNNQFMALHHTQFIENRVYEEDETIASKDDEHTNQNKNEKYDETSITENVDITRRIVEDGLRILNKHFERVEVPNSDSEDESGFSIIVQPKDIYMDRPIPYVIGSAEWHAHDHVGLKHADSSETIDEQGDDSDSSKLSSEFNIPRSSSVSSYEDLTPKGESHSYTAAETQDSDRYLIPEYNLQPDSDANIDNNGVPVQVKQSSGRPNDKFSAELASKLGIVAENKVVPIFPSDNDVYGVPNSTTQGIIKEDKKKRLDLFADEPPPLDESDQRDMFKGSSIDNNYLSDGGLFDNLDDEDDSLWGSQSANLVTKRDEKVHKRNSTITDLFGDQDINEVDGDIFSSNINNFSKKSSNLFSESMSDDLFSNVTKPVEKPFFPASMVRDIDNFISDQPPADVSIRSEPVGGNVQVAQKKRISKLSEIPYQSSSESENNDHTDASLQSPNTGLVFGNSTKSKTSSKIDDSILKNKPISLFSDDSGGNIAKNKFDSIFDDDDDDITFDFLSSKKSLFGNKDTITSDVLPTNNSNKVPKEDQITQPNISPLRKKTDLFEETSPYGVSNIFEDVTDDKNILEEESDIFNSEKIPKIPKSANVEPIYIFSNEPPALDDIYSDDQSKSSLFSPSLDLFTDEDKLFKKIKDTESVQPTVNIFEDHNYGKNLFVNTSQDSTAHSQNDMLFNAVDKEEDSKTVETLHSDSLVKIPALHSEPPSTDSTYSKNTKETVSKIQSPNILTRPSHLDLKNGAGDDRSKANIVSKNVSSLMKNANASVDETTSKTAIKEKSQMTSPPGKLSHNLKINVAALLPGAKRPKLPQDNVHNSIENITVEPAIAVGIEPTEIRSDSFSSKSVNIQTSVTKTVSFDDSVETVDVLQSLTQERARIPVKRRPSSRKARKQALRNDLDTMFDDTVEDQEKESEQNDLNEQTNVVLENDASDFQSDVLTLKSDRTQLGRDLFDSINAPTVDNSDTTFPNNNRHISVDESNSLLDVEQEIFPASILSQNQRSEFENIVRANPAISTEQPRSLFDDDDNDLFSIPKQKQSSLFADFERRTDNRHETEQISPDHTDLQIQGVKKFSVNEQLSNRNTISEPASEKLPIFKKTLEDSIFDDEDDSFLFGTEPKSNLKKQTNLFDDFPEGKIFSSSTLSKTTDTKKSLFADDDDDDIFGSSFNSRKSTNIAESNISKPENAATKVIKATSTIVYEDPLKLMQEDK